MVHNVACRGLKGVGSFYSVLCSQQTRRSKLEHGKGDAVQDLAALEQQRVKDARNCLQVFKI